MSRASGRVIGIVGGVVAALVALCGVSAQEAALPEYSAFVTEVKKRLQTDAALQAGYAYNERRVEQKLHASGRVTEERVKVFEVYPPLPGEEPYRRLIEEDGKPISAARLEKADRERQKKAEEYARKLSSRTPADGRRRTTRRRCASVLPTSTTSSTSSTCG
jgi:hypothetical protein